MKLYKYYPPTSHSFILLENGKISLRFSQPSALNDPFDLSPTIDINKDSFYSFAKKVQERTSSKANKFIDGNTGESYPRATLKEFEDSLHEKNVKQKTVNLRTHNDLSIGVLSLSKNENSSLMWSHYSQHHTGFMLEIENRFELNTQLKKAQDVVYCKNRPTTKQSESHSDKSYFRYKDPVWKYEDEMRLVVELHQLEPTEKTKNDHLPCYCYTYPRSQIGRIVLGAMCSKDVEECIRKWASEHTPKIIVQKAYLNAFNYQLDYK